MSGTQQQYTGLLKAGDIMMKYNDGSAINNLISFGQFFGRGNSSFTHAGIASSASTIIEMDGHGLQEHNLAGENSQYRYRVYRCVYSQVAAGAAAAAEMMRAGFAAGNTNITYSATGALGSISSREDLPNADIANDMLDKLLAGGDAFFCSGHVVLCYQMAASQSTTDRTFPFSDASGLFSLASTCYQPAYLEKVLSESDDFVRIGEFRGDAWTGA